MGLNHRHWLLCTPSTTHPPVCSFCLGVDATHVVSGGKRCAQRFVRAATHHRLPVDPGYCSTTISPSHQPQPAARMPVRERVTLPPAAPSSPPSAAEPAPAHDSSPPWAPLLADTQQHLGTEVQEFSGVDEPQLPDSPTNNRHSVLGSTSSDQLQHQQQHVAAGKGLRAQEPPQVLQHQLHAQQHEAPPRPTLPGPQPGIAHVHLIGEVTGARGLGPDALYCTWQLVFNTQLWSVLAGHDKGRTHASSPLAAEDGSLGGVVWETPLDVLLATSSAQHWPAIVFKLFSRSIWLGRDVFAGYSLATLPTTPGCHTFSCPVWVATEGRSSISKELTKLFTGLSPQLVNEAFITDLEQRYEQGQHLHTAGVSRGSSIWDVTLGGSPSSRPELAPSGRAVMWATAANGAAAGECGGGSSSGPFCSSFSAAGSGGAPAAGAVASFAGAGGCVTLRLHVLTRGLERLWRWRGDGGAHSMDCCLQRLHSSVDKLRRQQDREHVRLKAAVSEDGCGSEYGSVDGGAGVSHGVQLVRAGRADRLAAVQGRLLSSGRDSDKPRSRDQQQQGDGDGADDEAAASSLLAYTGGRRIAAGTGSAGTTSGASPPGGRPQARSGAEVTTSAPLPQRDWLAARQAGTEGGALPARAAARASERGQGEGRLAAAALRSRTAGGAV